MIFLPGNTHVSGPEKAEYYNDLAQNVFFPVYPVIAHQILKRADIDTGWCLDVGSGPGHLALSLATLSDLMVFAMDNSRTMCRVTEANVRKYRLESRVKPVFGNATRIPFDDASMHLIVSRESFFFWENLSGGFSEIMRVLRPGGMACIGNGFGNARLRDEIVSQMQERDPSWEEKRQEWYARCNPHIVRSALAAAGIFEYDLINDDSGYWVCFGKGR